MIDDRRYVLIPFEQITQEIMEACIQSSPQPQPVMFANDATDWRVMKWRGNKPPALWQHFPVYSNQEMVEILDNNIHPSNIV